jgi:hypothetical protein
MPEEAPVIRAVSEEGMSDKVPMDRLGLGRLVVAEDV